MPGRDRAENCGGSAVAARRLFGPGRRHLCRGAETDVDVPVVQVVVVPQVQFIVGYGRRCDHAVTWGSRTVKVPQIQFFAPSEDIPVASCRRHLCRGAEAVSLGPVNH